MRKNMILPLFFLLLGISCANESSFVQFDNNSDKTLKFASIIPVGEEDETRKIEVSNIPVGNTTSAYSIDHVGWSDSQLSNVKLQLGVKVATGTTTSATIILTKNSLTGLQNEKNNFIIIEGTYPNLTARTESK